MLTALTVLTTHLALTVSEAPVAQPDGKLSATEIYSQLFGHLTPHTYFSVPLFGLTWNFTNHTAVMLLAGAILVALFYLGHGIRNLRDGSAPRGRMPNLLESLVGFIVDEMIYPTMGKEVGRKFAPLFLTQFFFIWVVNLLGNSPLPSFMAGAPTSNLAVTAALATTTLLVMIAAGAKASGVIGMWKALVPHGLPPGIREVLFVVELVGFFIKPIALTIRLFANIFGGHLVVLSMFGLIYYFQSVPIFGAVLPMSIFVGILELLVAFLQAFIFTFLSIMFVQASVHPEH